MSDPDWMCCVVDQEEPHDRCEAPAAHILFFGPTPCDYTDVCREHLHHYDDEDVKWTQEVNR